jgi:hypothetical protein
MQFISGGPDIPDELLMAHEEGRVVFFCGAGISYPAGLPGFQGLVESIYRLNGTTPTLIEQEALNRSQYDATLNLLEQRIPGQRLAVRRAIANVLKPKLRRKGATGTHEALLRLARSREGALRLVTTNFDCIFEKAAKRSKQGFQAYAAPMLPIPKNSRWDGLVYLHGMLPSKADETKLNRLVVTSGDFGLAYLTERWAARFVSELFRNYVVCFVGYSINDPVLRYMMDALAADRMLGEHAPQAWALGDCEPGQELTKANEWAAKGVVPILYGVAVGTHDHSALHETLRVWAETYRDGVLGKERIVVSHALARPSGSTRQDDFVGRMLWALSDSSGLPAKQFAEFNPVPPLEWLIDAFSSEIYQHKDLPRFGVSPRDKVDSSLRFSLVRRPAPYSHASHMSLVSGGSISQWDDVMHHLARWLLRHLDDPALFVWISQRGGQLHAHWSRLIENELDRFDRLEREGRTTELDNVRAHAPNAVPGPIMRTMWGLLLASRIKAPWHELSLYRWKQRLNREGLTRTLRFELRDLLTPKLRVSKKIRWDEENKSAKETPHLGQFLDWELVPAVDHLRSSLQDVNDEKWKVALPILLEDFQSLLRDGLDLLRELGEADDRRDRSVWDLPSISPHWQNSDTSEWVAWIELVRDAWLVVQINDPSRASMVAHTWFDLPYPTFKRLALFAAAQDNIVSPEKWVEWLRADASWGLWSRDSMRETLRLLALQGRHLSVSAQERLEAAILAGPPRAMYREDLDPSYWADLHDRAIWLRMTKLKASGLVLGSTSLGFLGRMSVAHPNWQVAANERDEFSIWRSGTGDPDYEENLKVNLAPRRQQEIISWLKLPTPDRDLFYEDTWRDTCRTRFFHSFSALCQLSREGLWPTDRWREALQAWSEEGVVLRSWRYAAPLVTQMPSDMVDELAHPVTWWLESASKSIDRHELILLDLCRRVLAQTHESDLENPVDGDANFEPITAAINHPVGHTTQALLNMWLKGEPSDRDNLPVDIEALFTRLCDVKVDWFRHGRVLLSSRLIPLFRVDRLWTERWLLPFFDWEVNPVEARAVWAGFLWSPRLYQPLLVAFKPHFLATSLHYHHLGEYARQYAAFLTYAAIESVDGYSSEDFCYAIERLPQEGLEESAQALAQALEAAGDQRQEYWRNRIQPFWKHIWPKSLDHATQSISEDLMKLAIAAGSAFPSALNEVQGWFRPIEHPDFVVHRLKESGHCKQFPEGALQLLDAAIADQRWLPSELRPCIDMILSSEPKLKDDFRLKRLLEYVRRHGG